MKSYFSVTYKQDESSQIYSSNIAHAESAEDIQAHYAKHVLVNVRPAAAYEVEEARRKGKPIVEISPVRNIDNLDDMITRASARLKQQARQDMAELDRNISFGDPSER